MDEADKDPSVLLHPRTGTQYHPVCLWSTSENDSDAIAQRAYQRGYHYCVELFDRDRIWIKDRPRADRIIDTQHLFVVTPDVMEQLRNGENVDVPFPNSGT